MAFDPSVLFSFGGAVIAFVAVTLIAISNERFLKGELKIFLQKFIVGSYFMFSAILIQLIIDIAPLTDFSFSVNLIKSISIYMASVFFFLAANDIYELSKVLGFASNSLPKKLKKILYK
jgi:hypothetical protein